MVGHICIVYLRHFDSKIQLLHIFSFHILYNNCENAPVIRNQHL